MPEKYQIEIDDRAVLVVVRQYDSDGVVVIENIAVPDRAAEETHTCPYCEGKHIYNYRGIRIDCVTCNNTGQV